MGELITQLWYSSSLSFAACEARCPGLPPPLLEIGSPVAALWKCFTHRVNEGAEVPLGFPSPPPQFSTNLGRGRAFLGPRKAHPLPRPGLSACVAGKHANSLCIRELDSRSCGIKDCLTVFLSLQAAAEEWTWIIHYRLFPGKFCASEHGLYFARGYMDPKGWLITVHRTCLQHPKLCIPSSSYVLGTAVQRLWRHTGQVSLLFWRLQSQVAVLRLFGLRNPFMFLKTIIYLD